MSLIDWRGGANRMDVLSVLFVNPDEKIDDLEVRAGAPTNRYFQGGINLNKAKILEPENVDYLKPKLHGTQLIDSILNTRNPQKASLLIIEASLERDEDPSLNISKYLEPKEAMTFDFLPKRKDLNVYESIEQLLNHSDLGIRASMIEVLSCLNTFVEWLPNSGYDFVFPPIKVPDVRKDGVFFPGGRCDAIGLRLKPEVLNDTLITAIEDLNARNLKKKKIYPNAELFIQALTNLIGKDKIEAFDVIEFKLEDIDNYSPKRREIHLSQARSYLEMLYTHLHKLVEIRGNLVYLGSQTPTNIGLTHDRNYSWTVENIEELRKEAQIKAASKKSGKDLISRIKRLQESKEEAEKIIGIGTLSLEDCVVLSHYEGAARLGDGSVFILLPNDEALLISKSNNATYGEVIKYDPRIKNFKWELIDRVFLCKHSTTVKSLPLIDRHENGDHPLDLFYLVGAISILGSKLN